MGEPGQNSQAIGSASGADRVLFADGGQTSLPLRLSVGRAGLSVELSQPVSLGPVVVRELSLSLERLAFPIDLSKGVKQFLHRRTRASSLVLEFRLDDLVSRASENEFPAVGATPTFSIARVFEEGETALAISVRGERAVVAWDLVLSFGDTPSFVVDRARSLGTHGNALGFVLGFFDSLAERSSRHFGEPAFERAGRALRLGGIARSILLELAAQLGMRLPLTGDLRLRGAELADGKLSLEFGETSEILPIGRRGLRLAGLASHLESADDNLAKGEIADARERLLEALENAPGDRATLLALGEIDRGHDDRLESALSYFSEVLETESGMEVAARASLGETLLLAGRLELAKEQFLCLAEREGDAGMAALAYFFAHEIEVNPDERLRLLSLGLSRAPANANLSLARFRIHLERKELEAAASDAERYLARFLERSSLVSARVRIGNLYAEHGHLERAERVLSLAHREDPDSLEARYALGIVFLKRDAPERSVQMFVPLVRALGAPDAAEIAFGGRREELLAKVRLMLARSYAGAIGDLGLAVNELRNIESRGRLGAEARVLEGEFLAKLGQREGRLKAHFKLLEAIELGFIELEEGLAELLAATEVEVREGQRDFGRRACALVRQRLGERFVSDLSRSIVAEFSRLDAAIHT